MASTNTINLANAILDMLNGKIITFQRQDGSLLTASLYWTIDSTKFSITDDTSYYYVTNTVSISTNAAATDLASVSNPIVNIVIVDNSTNNILISQPTTPFTALSGDIITFFAGSLTLFKLNKSG